MSHDHHTLRLLRTLGECHRRMEQLAIDLRTMKEVTKVYHDVSMPELSEAFGFEEFVDAELQSGDPLSWGLEITVTATDIFVEAGVRRTESWGQYGIAEIAEVRYPLETEYSQQLREIVERLCEFRPL